MSTEIKSKEQPWGRIHQDVLKLKSLTERSLKSYIAISSFSGKKKTCKVLQQTIALRAGLKGEVPVSIGVKRLRKMNLLIVKKEKGVCDVYTLEPKDKIWGKIPIILLQDSSLSFLMLKVFCALSIREGKKGYCFPSRKTISEMCNVSQSNVSLAIYCLEVLGLLSVSRGERWNESESSDTGKGYLKGKKKNNSYWIHWKAIESQGKKLGMCQN